MRDCTFTCLILHTHTLLYTHYFIPFICLPHLFHLTHHICSTPFAINTFPYIPLTIHAPFNPHLSLPVRQHLSIIHTFHTLHLSVANTRPLHLLITTRHNCFTTHLSTNTETTHLSTNTLMSFPSLCHLPTSYHPQLVCRF